MFKQLSAFIILSALVFQNSTKLLIIADYYTSTAEYARNCINKSKPKLQCKGKCQMMKKLQEEEKKEQQNAEHRADFKSEAMSSKSFYASLAPRKFTEIIITHYIADETNVFAMPHSFFHPPNIA